jgi:hypothetical protein
MPGAFLYDNAITAASLSSNEANVPTMPLQNLQDAQPRRRARLNASSATIYADFNSERSVDCVALISTTLGAGATVRARVGSQEALVEAAPVVALDFMQPVPSSMAAWSAARGGALGATYFNSNGKLVDAAAGEWRIDHDPVTLQRRGLLLEPERTNYIDNPNCVGAVAGTPGTPPSGWSVSNNGQGLNWSILGVGTESGIAYMDVRLSGTSSGTNGASITPKLFAAAAEVGQAWTQSCFIRRVAGSLAGIQLARLYLREFTASNVFLGQFFLDVAPEVGSFAASRRVLTATLVNSATGRVDGSFQVFPFAGATVDVTFRIGLPQLEKGSFATSPIRPAEGAIGVVARPGDDGIVSISATDRATLFVDWFHQAVRNDGGLTIASTIVFDDNISSNIALRLLSGSPSPTDGAATAAFVEVANFADKYIFPPAVSRQAIAYAANDMAYSQDGGAAEIDTSGVLPALTRVAIIQSEAITYLRRLRAYSDRLSNAQLVALTATGSSLVASQVTGDTGTIAAEAEAANQGNVIMTLPAPAVGRYLRIDIENPTAAFTDIGVLAAGQLWRVLRGTAYGIREGRVILDRRDRNPFTGAEFPVPAIANPRFAAFTLPSLSVAEARGQHRALLAALGAAGDALWIAELNDTMAERNRRAIWGAVNAPGEDAAISRDNLPLSSRAFRIQERL